MLHTKLKRKTIFHQDLTTPEAVSKLNQKRFLEIKYFASNRSES